MTASEPDILEATRLPALCRGVCLYAGLPLPPATLVEERFVIRSGGAPPAFLAKLLEEAFLEDGIEISVDAEEEEYGGANESPRVVVRPGQEEGCPDEVLRKALATTGPLLIFAVERHGRGGGLLGVTWAAVPEEEPAPQGRYRAAVKSYECDTR